MVWEAISKTRKSVSSGIQTPWGRLKNLGGLRLVFSTHFSVFGYPDETLSHTCCMAFVSTFGHFFFLVIYWLSEFVFPATSSEILLAVLKRPSHVKLNVGQLVLANSNWCVWTTQQHVGKLLARIETSFICRQQFANMLLCRSHTPIWVCQHELANVSLTCEGRLTAKSVSPFFINCGHVTEQGVSKYNEGFKLRKCLGHAILLNYFMLRSLEYNKHVVLIWYATGVYNLRKRGSMFYRRNWK